MIEQIQMYGLMFILIGFGMLGLAIVMIWKYLKQKRNQKQPEVLEEVEEEEDPLRLLE